MPGALDGIRVIDFTQLFAGPGTGMYLADQGADVVKVEPPNGGIDRPGTNMSDSFVVLNRGKRSIALDIRTPAGRKVVEALVRRADVMLVAWPPGQAERLGCGYEEMAGLNPRLVYASITGWGNTGPLAHRLGYDRLHQAFSGVMDNNRAPDGTPVAVPFYIADMSIPMLLSYGILLALFARERTGRGQKVETSQLELQIAMQSIHLVFRESAGSEETRVRRPPQQAYATSDGRHMVVMPYTEDDWQALGRLLDLPELAGDSSLNTRGGRESAAERFASEIAAAFASRPLTDWDAALEEAGIPHAPVLSREEFARHPHVWENQFLTQLDQPSVGPVTMMSPPVRLSDTPSHISRPAPAFGQNTREVLSELGFSESEIEEMVQAGVAKA